MEQRDCLINIEARDRIGGRVCEQLLTRTNIPVGAASGAEVAVLGWTMTRHRASSDEDPEEE